MWSRTAALLLPQLLLMVRHLLRLHPRFRRRQSFISTAGQNASFTRLTITYSNILGLNWNRNSGRVWVLAGGSFFRNSWDETGFDFLKATQINQVISLHKFQRINKYTNLVRHLLINSNDQLELKIWHLNGVSIEFSLCLSWLVSFII